MKDKDNDLLSRFGRRDGMTVPDGFFDDFARRMMASLPENAEAEGTVVVPAKTVWQRIRPYVYMAAMFAGIWCMLKMFTMMSNTSTDLSIDNNKILTEALSDDNFVIDHFIDDINERELLDEIYDDSIEVDELEMVDFEMDLDPASADPALSDPSAL